MQVVSTPQSAPFSGPQGQGRKSRDRNQEIKIIERPIVSQGSLFTSAATPQAPADAVGDGKGLRSRPSSSKSVNRSQPPSPANPATPRSVTSSAPRSVTSAPTLRDVKGSGALALGVGKTFWHDVYLTKCLFGFFSFSFMLPVLMVRCGYGNFRLRAACCQETCRGSNIHISCYPHNCTIKMAFVLYERIQISCLALTNDLIHTCKSLPALKTIAYTPENQRLAWHLRHEIQSDLFFFMQSDLFFHIFMQSNDIFSSYFPFTVFVTTYVHIRKHSLTRTMTILLYSGRTSREVRQDFSWRYINCDWWQRDRVAPHWPYQGYVGQCFSQVHTRLMKIWRRVADRTSIMCASWIICQCCVFPAFFWAYWNVR